MCASISFRYFLKKEYWSQRYCQNNQDLQINQNHLFTWSELIRFPCSSKTFTAVTAFVLAKSLSTSEAHGIPVTMGEKNIFIVHI